MREFNTPAAVQVPDSDTAPTTAFRRAEQEPDAVVMRRNTGDTWQDVTAREFCEQVTRLAKGLMATGIEAGDRVALMAPTRYEWTLIDYAIWTSGAVVVPIYDTSSPEQVEWIVNDSGAKAAFVNDATMKSTFDSLRDKLSGLGEVWTIDDGAVDSLSTGHDDITDEAVRERLGTRVSTDLATIVYTSGTTGRPKGCEVTHRNLLGHVRNAVEGSLQRLFSVKGGSTLLFLPLAHIFARIIEVGSIEAGTVLGHTADLANVAPSLASFKPNFILAVPRVFEKVYNTAEQKAVSEGKGKIFHTAAEAAIAYSRAQDSGGAGIGLRLKHSMFDKLVYGKLRAAVGGRVEYAVSGGAALEERLGHFFRGVGITILEGYGLTETTAAGTVNPPDENRVGTVGKPTPSGEVKIADDGEILFRGPFIFTGYWNNEQATKETLDDEGWMHTGDLGELDDEGYLKITGRKKEILVTAGGKNVSPGPMEDRIRAHPLVSQCMVVGDGRPFIGCIVTLDPEALEFWCEQHGKPKDSSIADLREDPDVLADIQTAVDAANASVSRAEAIKKIRILDRDLTQEDGHLTPKLSVRRSVVAKDFAADLEALYSS